MATRTKTKIELGEKIGLEYSKPEGISEEVFRETVPKKYKKHVTPELVETINKVIDDPAYGEEWKLSMLSSLNVLEKNANWSIEAYINAVRFQTMIAMGVSIIDSYKRTFPERVQARLDNMPEGAPSSDIRIKLQHHAVAYNNGELVNLIRAQSKVPFNLINQAARQEVFNIGLDIARNGRSEVARVTAINTILAATAPDKENKVEVQLGYSKEAQEAQAAQTEGLREIALNQREMIKLGFSIDEVQSIQISHNVVDAEIDEADDFENRQCMRN